MLPCPGPAIPPWNRYMDSICPYGIKIQDKKRKICFAIFPEGFPFSIQELSDMMIFNIPEDDESADRMIRAADPGIRL